MTRRKKRDPDTTRCTTRKVGAVIPGTVREMYYCGNDNCDCTFAMPVGWDIVCKHPENHSFASEEPEDSGLDGATSVMQGG